MAKPSAHGVECGLLYAAAAVALYDGVRTMIRHRTAVGGLEAGAYLVVLGLVLVGLTLAYGARGTAAGPAAASGNTRVALLAFMLFAGYTLAIQPLGYLLATALFFGLYLRAFGRYGWRPVVISAVAVAVASTYLWYQLAMDLPVGIVPWP